MPHKGKTHAFEDFGQYPELITYDSNEQVEEESNQDESKLNGSVIDPNKPFFRGLSLEDFLRVKQGGRGRSRK